jgi:hypothetical protein
MQEELARFKIECVQAPQRAKVAIKRRLDQQIALCAAAEKLSNALTAALDDVELRGLPSSNNGRLRQPRARGLLDDLQALGAVVAVREADPARKHPYTMRVADDGRRIVVEVTDALAQPRLGLAGCMYALRAVEARPNDPPVIVQNRPRQIIFNLAHDVFRGEVRQAAIEMVMALELAYLIAPHRSDEDLYNRVLTLLAAT